MRKRQMAQTLAQGLSAAMLAMGASICAAQAAPEEIAAPTAFARAEARLRDAESLGKLTSEGRLLYARDRVKLTPALYCGQSLALAERGWFRESIEAASKVLYLGVRDADVASQANAKRDLAIAYSYAGDLAAAEQYARQAIDDGKDQPANVLAPAHKVLGDVEARRGLFAKAVQQYETALSLASDKFRPLVLLSLANLHIAQQQPARARKVFAQIGSFADEGLKTQRLRTEGNLLLAEDQAASAHEVFSSITRLARGSDADYTRVWALEGQGRAQEVLGNKAAALADYLSAAEAAERIRARFHSEEFKTGLFGNTQTVFERAIRLLVDEGRFREAWDISERSRARSLLDSLKGRVSADMAAQSGQAANPLAALQQALQSQEVLIEYHVLPGQIVLWEIRAESFRTHVLPVARKDLSDDVTAFREAITSRRRSAAVALGDSLGETLLGKLSLHTEEALIIVPHGALHYLPFQALRQDDRWLIERYPLAIQPSATIAARILKSAPPSTGSLVAFGNPEIDERHTLPAAEREVGEISRHFTNKTVYIKREASRPQFLKSATGGGILHVAAHAEADSADALRSRILFSPVEREPDPVPDYVYANDIYDLNLKGVSLVTISACESGLGRIADGDEVLGFPRSFLTAGARSVVSSLWPVSDESTEVLMSTFYKALASGEPAASALRKGQLAVIKRRGNSHPFYWAPFNLIGDGRLQLADRQTPRTSPQEK